MPMPQGCCLMPGSPKNALQAELSFPGAPWKVHWARGWSSEPPSRASFGFCVFVFKIDITRLTLLLGKSNEAKHMKIYNIIGGP